MVSFVEVVEESWKVRYQGRSLSKWKSVCNFRECGREAWQKILGSLQSFSAYFAEVLPALVSLPLLPLSGEESGYSPYLTKSRLPSS
jgi:hypothetical protein